MVDEMTAESRDRVRGPGFVWRAGENPEPILVETEKFNGLAIFDVRAGSGPEVPAALIEAGVRDLFVTRDQIDPARLPKGWDRIEGLTLWLDCDRGASPLSGADLEALAPNLKSRLVPVSGRLDFLTRLAEGRAGLNRIGCRPAEGLGLVGTETGSIMLSTLSGAAARNPLPPELFFWGGIGTPEGAAAFLAAGADGLVFEALHRFTDLGAEGVLPGSLPESTSPDLSVLLRLPGGLGLRVLSRSGSTAADRTLEDLAGESDPARAWTAVQDLSSSLEGFGEALPDPERLLGYGPEAAFGPAFADRFGTGLGAAGKGFREAIESSLESAREAVGRFSRGPAAEALGTAYAFIQGAMTWITDRPDFARAVAHGGGLPTLALGWAGRAELEEKLAGLKTALNGRPYAVNLIPLAENPGLDGQVGWVLENRPPFVTLAAGERALDLARDFEQRGIRVIQVVSETGLLRLAIRAGVRLVVLEGQEAGGHVGTLSTLTLAESVLELKRTDPDLFDGVRIFLAGGFHDARSALWGALLGADGLQLGTAYLATREIISSGSVEPLYQRLVVASEPGGTGLTGESVGLRVRSLATPKLKLIGNLERELQADRTNEQEIRIRLETATSGSLAMASRAVDLRTGRRLTEDESLVEGQFMSGAVAGVLDRIRTVAQLHRELAGEAFSALGPNLREPIEESDRLAVTGMALVNSLGQSPAEVWEASLAMRSGVVEVGNDRGWNHDEYYSPDPRAEAKTYSRVGAFHNLEVDRHSLGIAPQDFRTMANSTRTSMWLAKQAIDDSGILDSEVNPERIGMLISQNAGEASSSLFNTFHFAAAKLMADEMTEVADLGEDVAELLLERVMEGRVGIDDTTMLGRLNSTAAGYICNKYGFMGPSHAITAACASSLAALYSATQMIREGHIDAALVGGGEEPITLLHYLEFSALGALAGLMGGERAPTAYSRPFDADRDGIVLGEGGAMIMVERESVARRRGAHIWAYINGLGASNSPQGMIESVAEYQLVAIRAGLAQSGFDPATVGLVECHATGTMQGDGEEVKALKSVLPRGSGTVLSSLKSQTGHTLGASGLNGMIRAIQAMNNGAYPGSLNYDTPDPALDPEGWGLRILSEPEDWPIEGDKARRTLVDSFGFGGANYVAFIEEARANRATGGIDPRSGQPALSAPDRIFLFESRINDREVLISLAAKDRAEAEEKLALPGLAERLGRDLEEGSLTGSGPFVRAKEAEPPRFGLALSGQGSYYSGMGRRYYETYEVFRERLDRLAKVADYDLIELLFESSEDRLRQTRWQQPALFALGYSLAGLLFEEGFKPAALAGHSLGELTGLTLAGVFSPEDGFRLVDFRGRLMKRLAEKAEQPSTMIAVAASEETLGPILEDYDGVRVTNFNSPRQLVLGGPVEKIERLKEELGQRSIGAVRLKVSMAFHSPLMAAGREELNSFLETLEISPPKIPVISNVTAEPYPDDPAEIRRLILDHEESPVRWRETVEYLTDEPGLGCFVEVGPQDTVSGLIEETAPGAICLPTCRPRKEVAALVTALAGLTVLGGLEHLPEVEPITLPEEDPEQAGDKAEEESTLEALIRIIMDATGYDRSEIEADMDLRTDLSIRSSRLPVIVDAIERRFRITLRFEDFAGLRTIREMADRIDYLVAHGGSGPGRRFGQGRTETERPIPSRYVVKLKPALTGPEDGLLESLLPKGGRVAVLAVGGPDLARKTAEALSGAGDSEILRYDLDLSKERPGWLRIEDGQGRAEAPPADLSGLVLALDDGPEIEAAGLAAAPDLLLTLFMALKTYFRSPEKRLGLALTRTRGPVARVLAEGLSGMFLCTALEPGQGVYKALHLPPGEESTPLAEILSRGLAVGLERAEVTIVDGRPQVGMITEEPLAGDPVSDPLLGLGRTILCSGGGLGVTFRLLKGLAPYQPRLIILGRSVPEPDDRGNGGRLAANLKELERLGCEVHYHPCDVTDREMVAEIVGRAARRFGRIDGLIHGAGVLRDIYLDFMWPGDFREVVDIKLKGGLNLYRAAAGFGLRFAVGLSSMTSVLGNTGQVNYGAANRALGGLFEALGEESGQTRIITLCMPPMEEVGMAADPEIVSLFMARGWGEYYLGPDELAGMLRRELIFGDQRMVRVLPGRAFPRFALDRPEQAEAEDAPAEDRLRRSLGLDLAPEDLPLIDRIEGLDLGRGRGELRRTFSLERDLWLDDHRPLKEDPRPLVSAVAALETLMEAAWAMFPDLEVCEVRDFSARNMIEVPEEGRVQVRIRTKVLDQQPGRVVVQAGMVRIEEGDEDGPRTDPPPAFSARISLGGELPDPNRGADHHVYRSELTYPDWDQEKVLNIYNIYTGLQGMYKMVTHLDGTSLDRVLGRMRYPDRKEYRDLAEVRYRYPLYVLEAMIQAAVFGELVRDSEKEGSIIPSSFERLQVFGRPVLGREYSLHATYLGQGEIEHETIWNLQAEDPEGRVLLRGDRLRVHRY